MLPIYKALALALQVQPRGAYRDIEALLAFTLLPDEKAINCKADGLSGAILGWISAIDSRDSLYI
jgi:hypothetical protein